ncbi:hypothetical protein [Pedobacter sp. Leaf250]|uniref:AbiU2 domain-containing protein n=1 Tax=Pedobacter sp. Leaf250 TaxID=2876559 RepID=UPI001E31F87A|nr:hypothetical protein [Pedobacter sp. Leaf250]
MDFIMSNRDILTLDEIYSFIEYLKTFIYDLEICSDNIEQVINAQSEGVNLIPIQHFIGHYIFLSYSHIAITAYKIFHSGEKRSFFKLFNKIDNFSYEDSLKRHLEQNGNKDENLIKNRSEFKEITAILIQKINTKDALINKIKLRRSTFYAHSDPKNSVKPETLEEIKELKEFSKNIFNLLYGKFKDTHFSFNFNIASIRNVIEDRKLVDGYYGDLEKEM